MAPRLPPILLVAATLSAFLATGCPQPSGPGKAGVPLGLPPSVKLYEDFEGETWLTLEGSGANLAPRVSLGESHQGSGSLFFPSREILSHGTLSARAKTLDLPLAANLRFWYKTDIGGGQSGCETWFRVYDNDKLQAQFTGLGQPWKVYDLTLSAGTHHLRFSVEKDNGIFFTGQVTNAVWIDQVSVCDDTTETVVLTPAGDQRSVVGHPLVQYEGSALRWDGSVRPGQPVQISVVPGTGSGFLGGDGTFTGSAEGTCTVGASSGEVRSSPGTMTVLPADHWNRGTWQGGAWYEGLTAASGTAIDTSNRTFTDNSPGVSVAYRIDSPAKANLTADGFFTVSGTVAATNPAYQYLLLVVQKVSDPSLQTFSWLRGDFTQRIWLRFGAGSYTVSLHPSRQTTNNLDYEGDLNGCTYWGSVATFTVNNTRNEDGRFLYPSDPLQADALEIFNAASSVTAGLTSDRAKLKALHDYTVRALDYDHDSLMAGQRKKQDALTVLALHTGVCEGYASLFGALGRAVGLRVKAVSGDGGTGNLTENHAWNLVTYGGMERMIDCTWDDPGGGSTATPNDRYFLCDPSGSGGDHTWLNDRPERAFDWPHPNQVMTVVEGGPFGGYPAGWY